MPLQSLAPLGARAGRLRLTPEEEDSLLGDLAGAGTSALGLIGDILGTPGGVIRNIAAGRFEDVLPGILDPERRISGRDLAQQYGLVGDNHEGFDLGDVVGFGTEVALDPLTFIGGGITKAGTVAKSLGKFPKKSLFDVGTGALSMGKRAARRGTLSSVLEGADDATMSLAKQLAEKQGSTLDNLLAEPMQRSIGVGLPFMGNAVTVDLPGAAGRATKLDALGGWVSKTAPARYTAKMFDATVRNVGDWTGQLFSKAAHAEMDPAKRAAGADINRFHLGLSQLGVADQDLQSDILEGISRNPEAPVGVRLTEDQILDYNVLPLDGEAPEALQARKAAIRDIRQQFQTSQEGVRRQREAVGLPAARFESERIDYAPREATWENYGKVNTSKRRRDALRNLGRTEVDAILKDDQLRELAKQTEVNPLSPEELTKQVPDEIRQDLANMGYEDLEDLVPWQADQMRNADPQTEAWNATADAKQALDPLKDQGFTEGRGPYNQAVAGLDRPEMSRTTALPKPQTHTERFQQAVRRVDELLGRDATDWDKAPQWLEQARQLPKLQRELEELRGRALAGDYAVSLPEQDAALQLQIGNAEQALAAYQDAKSRLDMRDIFSRERPDEYFDYDRMLPEEKTLLEFSQQRAAFDSHAYRTELASLDAQAAELRKEIERLGKTTAKGEMSVKDATKRFTVGQAVKAIRKQEANIEELTTQLAETERQAGLLRSSIDEGVAAKAELAAMEQSFRERGFFKQGDAQYLKDQELREIAALRAEADQLPKYRARQKRLQERIERGERQIMPAEQIDELQAELGEAEVAAAHLEALSARAKEARYFIDHARNVPQKALDENKRFYGNAPMHDAAVTTAKDLEDIAFAKQMHKVYAGNVVRVKPGEQVDAAQMVPWTEAVRQLGVGKTASQQAKAIRAAAEELQRYGKITPEEFDNIAGPHAVATSAVKQDPVLAQELRNAELGDFVKGITGEYEKRVALLQQKHTGAELAKQLADLEDRFKTARTAGIERINAAPLTDTSHAGRLMQVKRDMHQKLYAAADDARLSGQMDDESYQALRAEADEWLKGKTKGTTESVQEFQRLWEQAVAKDPIPDDGLLMMKNLYVPREVVDSLSRAKNFRNAPAEEGFGHWADWWRRLTKGHLTMPFPSFHVRNAFNMAYQYGNAGVRDPRHGLAKGFLQPWKDAWQVLQGKKVNDFAEIPAIQAMGLKGDDAERQLVAAAESYAGLKGAGDVISEGAEPAFTPFGKKEHEWGTTVEQFTAALPGGRPLNRDYILEPLAQRFGKARFNPANVEQFAPIAIGGRLSNTTENVGRLATFIGLLRQGKSFEEAGALTKAMHVDYSDLTAFEKNVARRVVPFWTWSRHMIPFTLRQFIEKPSGLYAQTARFSRLAEQDSGFLPPQLGGSLAIPIGQEEDGTQRYLSQMDLPAESLNRLLNPSSMGDTVRSALAQADPFLKFAVETGTGKSLFRGRNLEDLESPTGRLLANLVGEEKPLWKSTTLDSLLANSPASRYLSTAAQAGDDRKGAGAFALNTLSGLKLTDVPMDRARDVAAGEAAKKLLKATGARTVESLSISKEDMDAMDPATRAEAEQLQAVLRALARKGKERRKPADNK